MDPSQLTEQALADSTHLLNQLNSSTICFLSDIDKSVERGHLPHALQRFHIYVEPNASDYRLQLSELFSAIRQVASVVFKRTQEEQPEAWPRLKNTALGLGQTMLLQAVGPVVLAAKARQRAGFHGNAPDWSTSQATLQLCSLSRRILDREAAYLERNGAFNLLMVASATTAIASAIFMPSSLVLGLGIGVFATAAFGRVQENWWDNTAENNQKDMEQLQPLLNRLQSSGHHSHAE